MEMERFNLINEVFVAEFIPAMDLDYLLANGWRHFGRQFFRYNVGYYKEELRVVLPLRIRLSDFRPSQSQRRVLRKNRDVELEIGKPIFDDQKHRLFELHKDRFDHGVPQSIYTFLDPRAGEIPCETLEFTVRIGGRLAAVSYLDIGDKAVSAVYAMFDPEFSQRSLGIYTMLAEISFASEIGKRFYYQGYAYEGSSFYDYKKGFDATEVFDWHGNWLPMPRVSGLEK
ncbi:MAG: hypothetical protein R2684_02480 [Pyrinomonadaceae bacterium]